MFCEGEYVMYSGEGLCRIEKIGIPEFQSEKRKYYFLRNVDNSRIYVPTDTTQPMRYPLTSSEAEAFLKGLALMRISVPKKIDSKKRMPMIKETVRDQTAEAMAKTIKMIRSLHSDGKIPTDEKMILTRTEKHLCDEIAFALHISEEEAEFRVRNAIKALAIQEKSA